MITIGQHEYTGIPSSTGQIVENLVDLQPRTDLPNGDERVYILQQVKKFTRIP